MDKKQDTSTPRELGANLYVETLKSAIAYLERHEEVR